MVTVRELADELFVIRTIFDSEKTQVIARTSGFVRTEDGDGQSYWERFDDTLIEAGYNVDDIISADHRAGWRKAWAAALPDLGSALRKPENTERCFFVAEA